MALTRTTYRAKWADRPLATFTKADRIDPVRMISRAVLSAPFPDLTGDVVVAKGIDPTHHKRDPYIDLEHGRDPYIKGAPVASALSSLWEPGGEYGFHLADLNFGTDDEPDYHEAAICTSYFDKSQRVSSQVFALVEQDALPAVSIEFSPRRGFFKAIGRSELENRPAYQFDVCDLRRWSICAKGVCPFALTLTKSALREFRQQVPPELEKILSDKWISVGGLNEPLCEVIYKALAPPTAPAKRTTVRVETPAVQKGQWDESKHHRDGGKFAAAPHVHATPEQAKRYGEFHAAGTHNLKDALVRSIARKKGADAEQVKAELDHHAGLGAFPHIHTTPDQVKRYAEHREMGTHNIADSMVRSIARKTGAPEETVKAELDHHASQPVKKATMNPTAAPPQPAAPAPAADLDPANEEAAPEDDGGPAKPTVEAHYGAAQGLLELADTAERQLQASEHVKGKQHLMEKLEQMRTLAGELKAMGDKIDAEVSGAPGGDDEADAEADDDEQPEDGADEGADDTEEDDSAAGDEKPKKGKGGPPWKKALARDDDGVLVDVREPYYGPLYQKAVAFKRFPLAAVEAAQREAAAKRAMKKAPPRAPEPSAEELADTAYLAEQTARLARTLHLYS